MQQVDFPQGRHVLTKKATSTAFAFIIAGLFIYIVFRAWLLSFTHDEGLTFTILNGDDFWVLTANNHWINTILSYISARSFGYSELALRLPNVLSFLLYSYFCFMLVARRSRSIAATIIALFFLLFNHYLLEFFSLSRGYGIALGCFSGALYCFIELSDNRAKEFRLLAVGILFSLCAIYANYSFIIPVAAAQIAYLVCLYKDSRGRFSTLRHLFRFLGRRLIWFALELLFLLPALYNIIVLKERQQLYFGGTIGVIHDTLFSVFGSTFPIAYLPYQQWIVLSIVVLIAIASLFSTKRNSFLFIGIVVFVSILLPVILHYSINMKYPLGRAALYWVVLIGVLVHRFLEYLSDKQAAVKLFPFIILFCLTAAATASAVKAMNLQYASSWRGDADTRRMLEFLESEMGDQDRKCNLMTNWYYSSAVNYYKISKGYDWLNTASRKDWLIAENKRKILAVEYDYFYLPRKKWNKDTSDKVHVRDFQVSDTVLLKRGASNRFYCGFRRIHGVPQSVPCFSKARAWIFSVSESPRIRK